MKHKVQIRKGVIYPLRPQRFNEEIQFFEGKSAILIIEDENPEASKDSFGYYFFNLQWYIDNTEFYAGNESKDLDKYFCRKYLSYKRMIILDGSPHEEVFIDSKSTIGKKAFGEFLTKVIQEMAENTGVVPPSREETNTGKFATKTINTENNVSDNEF